MSTTHCTYFVALEWPSGRTTEETIHGTVEAPQEAMTKAERLANSVSIGSPEAAALRLAALRADGEDDFEQDGAYLVRKDKGRAISAERGRSEYVALGAYLYRTGQITERAAA